MILLLSRYSLPFTTMRVDSLVRLLLPGLLAGIAVASHQETPSPQKAHEQDVNANKGNYLRRKLGTYQDVFKTSWSTKSGKMSSKGGKVA